MLTKTSKGEYSAIYEELQRRDQQSEYFTDDRSGSDQVTDSEEEFDSIVRVDNLLNSFQKREDSS